MDESNLSVGDSLHQDVVAAQQVLRSARGTRPTGDLQIRLIVSAENNRPLWRFPKASGGVDCGDEELRSFCRRDTFISHRAVSNAADFVQCVVDGGAGERDKHRVEVTRDKLTRELHIDLEGVGCFQVGSGGQSTAFARRA